MISLRVFIATLALAVKLDNVRAAYTTTSPVSFYYKLNDKIFVNIILQNVPAEANRYVLYYQTENCDRSTIGQHSTGCDARHKPTLETHVAMSDTLNELLAFLQQKLDVIDEVSASVQKKLDRSSLRIYITLLQNGNKTCATKWIMDGLRDDNANENQFSKDCLNKFANFCEVTADFGNKCEEHTRAKIYCSKLSGLLTCELLDELPEDTEHQWYQVYRDGSLIGTIPTVKGKKTEFKMRTHTFDSNTYISSAMNSTHFKQSLRSEEFKIKPTNGHENPVLDMYMKKYTANEQYSFKCLKREHTQIGVIEPTGYHIKTFTYTTYTWTLTKEHNGSVFCCLNYRTYNLAGIKKIVERTVTDFTVLIYEEPVNHDIKVSITDLPLSTPSIAPEEEQNTPAVTPDRYQPRVVSTSPSDSAGQYSTDPHSDPSSDKFNYYIPIASVAGIILLTSLIYVVIKKCWRKSSDPDQTLQLETYTSTNMVLYAELDIRPGTGPAPASTENATYAEIIGVLRPENGHVKK